MTISQNGQIDMPEKSNSTVVSVTPSRAAAEYNGYDLANGETGDVLNCQYSQRDSFWDEAPRHNETNGLDQVISGSTA